MLKESGLSRERHPLAGVGCWLASLIVCLMVACRGEAVAPAPAIQTCAPSDTDGDGLPDAWEVLKYRTDPLSADSDGDGIADGDWLERREFTYSLRAIVEVAVPLPPMEELNTIFQDVRLLGRRGHISELEVVLYPGARVRAGTEKYARKNRCVIADFEVKGVEPTFAAEMRALAGSAEEKEGQMGVLLDSLFKKTKREVPFNAFYLVNDGGEISLEPLAGPAIRDPEADPRELWYRELDPATMWNRRARGECTSSAVLGQAGLQAIGLASRLILFLPFFTASQDVLDGIWDKRVLRGLSGRRVGVPYCTSHTAVEIFTGEKWLLSDEERIRITPFELGLGPLIQLRTAPSISELIEPALWGAACGGNGPLEGSRNVYRIVSLSDHWGEYAKDLEVLGVGRAPPSTIMIEDIFPFDSEKRPAFIPKDAVDDPARFFLAKADIDEAILSSIPYFYRCADKILPPFKFVRGYWGPYFLLEKSGDSLTVQEIPERSASGCRWVLAEEVATRTGWR